MSGFATDDNWVPVTVTVVPPLRIKIIDGDSINRTTVEHNGENFLPEKMIDHDLRDFSLKLIALFQSRLKPPTVLLRHGFFLWLFI